MKTDVQMSEAYSRAGERTNFGVRGPGSSPSVYDGALAALNWRCRRCIDDLPDMTTLSGAPPMAAPTGEEKLQETPACLPRGLDAEAAQKVGDARVVLVDMVGS